MHIRVLVADDHPIVRSGIRNELARQADIEVVGEAADGEEVLSLAEKLQPDVILLDLRMPGMKAVQVLRALQKEEPTPAVLVLSAYGDLENVRGMLRAGARGYLVKDMDPQAILEGIRAVASGGTWVAPKVMQGLMEYTASEQAETENEELSPREREVLQLLGKGYSNSRIADEMDVKERTVRLHLENLMSKMGVDNRVEAVLAAIRRGWIDL